MWTFKTILLWCLVIAHVAVWYALCPRCISDCCLKQFFVTYMFCCSVLGRDFYDILHVHRSADEATIKRSYRKLALKLHPDKVQGTEEEKKKAAEKFAEVGHAYEVLMDPKKRQIYDRYGEEGLKSMGDGGGGGGGMDPNDIFSQFFGGAFGGFGFGGPQEEEELKGETVQIGLEVTLEDLYNGKEFKVTRDKNVLRPAPGKRDCNCKQKLVTKSIGPGMFQQFTKTECEKCDNVKFVRESDDLTVSLEPGMVDGQEIVFFEEGEPVIDGEPGDLVFVVQTRPHDVFTRINTNDLHMNLVVSLLEALVGFEKKIKHLDGHEVTIASKGVVSPGDVLTFKGEGMPVYDTTRKGSLFVNITVSFPKSLKDEEKEKIKKIFSSTSWKHDEL
jgi:DnaJ family protein B protein 11